MQCVHDPMFSSHSTNAVANIEKIRSKYVLSKIIDGLEKSAIVGQNLTTNTIYMMSNVEDEAVDSTFNFTKRIISEKKATQNLNMNLSSEPLPNLTKNWQAKLD